MSPHRGLLSGSTEQCPGLVHVNTRQRLGMCSSRPASHFLLSEFTSNPQNSRKGGGMAQQLKTLTTPVENPSLDPSTHIWWLTTACNSSTRGSDATGLHQHLHLGVLSPSSFSD